MNSSTEADNDLKEFAISKSHQILSWLVTIAFLVFLLVGWPDGKHLSKGESYNNFMRFAGFISFSVVAFSVLSTQSKHPGTVLTISPSGIRDARCSDVEIPWVAILAIANEVHQVNFRKMKYLNIEVDESMLPKDRNGFSKAMPGIGSYKLRLDVTNLEGFDFDAMFQLCERHLARARSTEQERGGRSV